MVLWFYVFKLLLEDAERCLEIFVDQLHLERGPKPRGRIYIIIIVTIGREILYTC
jgi:hypothetical protein